MWRVAYRHGTSTTVRESEASSDDLSPVSLRPKLPRDDVSEAVVSLIGAVAGISPMLEEEAEEEEAGEAGEAGTRSRERRKAPTASTDRTMTRGQERKWPPTAISCRCGCCRCPGLAIVAINEASRNNKSH